MVRHRSSARTATVALLLVGTGCIAAPAHADPAPGIRSNMGLCSSYLAGLPAPVFPPAGSEPLGGNARSGVNLIVKDYGWMLADAPASPGELYRVRARQHPTDPAEVECTRRHQS
jgi:hypothetical protein